MTDDENVPQIELETKRFELRANKLRLALDFLKTVAAIVGAIALFWIVQQPESLINRESSKESIARERAKLLLEWIREENPTKRAEALAVISASYGEGTNEWLRPVEKLLGQRATYESLEKLINEKRLLLEKLKTQFDAEVTGKGRTGSLGFGPVARELRDQIAKIDSEIQRLLQDRNVSLRSPGLKQ